MLEQVEAGQHAQNLKMDVLQAIRFVILAWKEIKMETIFNCWQHTKILPEKYQTEYQNVSDNPDRKSTRLNSSHESESRMPSSA